MDERDPFDQLGPVRGPAPGFAQELMRELNDQNHLDNPEAFPHHPVQNGQQPNAQQDRDIEALDEQIQMEEQMQLLDFTGSEGSINNYQLANGIGTAKEILKLFCRGLWTAIYYLVRFAFPLASIIFTIYMSFSGTDYYTLQQVVIIIYTCIVMLIGIQHALIVFLFNRNANMILTLILAFSNFSIWDEFHENGFFSISAFQKDLNYRINSYQFFGILLLNIGIVVIWTLFISGILIYMLVKSIRDRHRFNQEKKILVNLLKTKLAKWKKDNPEKTQKIIANHTTEKSNETAFFCCICYMPIHDESMMTELPECNHIFHHSCVRDWLDKNPKCPYCRTNTIQALQRKLRAQQNNQPVPLQQNEAA